MSLACGWFWRMQTSCHQRLGWRTLAYIYGRGREGQREGGKEGRERGEGGKRGSEGREGREEEEEREGGREERESLICELQDDINLLGQCSHSSCREHLGFLLGASLEASSPTKMWGNLLATWLLVLPWEVASNCGPSSHSLSWGTVSASVAFQYKDSNTRTAGSLVLMCPLHLQPWAGILWHLDFTVFHLTRPKSLGTI